MSAREPSPAPLTLRVARVTDAVDALLAVILAEPATPQSRRTPLSGPVVLIDGRSGSGKTDLADALAAAWPGAVTLIHLDDIYPGWSGLEAASRHVHDFLLAAGGQPGVASDAAPGAVQSPRWRRHDWSTGRAAEWVVVDPALPLIVEGSGSLSRQNAACATVTVWLELDEQTRRRRALARDGEAYEPFWDMWAEQELEFITRENPRGHARVVVDLTLG
ncbi:AAA family ATPase [soil metagenome]